MAFIQKIISGGQTGADRAAHDFAIAHGIPHGGWCPKNRIAEDGLIAEIYHLKETPSEDYAQRTEWNVRDSDGTLILSLGKKLQGGSLRTLQFAKQLKKPVLHLSATGTKNPEGRLQDFIYKHQIKILNVAGPRASKEPEVGHYVFEVLAFLL